MAGQSPPSRSSAPSFRSAAPAPVRTETWHHAGRGTSLPSSGGAPPSRPPRRDPTRRARRRTGRRTGRTTPDDGPEDAQSKGHHHELATLPRPRAGRPTLGRGDRDDHRAARRRPRRDGGAPSAACRRAPDGRPLHLHRPDGTGRVPYRPGNRRAAAPAYQPGDGHLPARGRDPAPGQPGHQPGDPPGRRQLDARRARHRAFGAHGARAARQRPTALRHADLGRPARRRRGERARLRPPPRGGAAAACRRSAGLAADRGGGARVAVAAGHRLGDALRRCRAWGRRPARGRSRLRGAGDLHPGRAGGGGRRRPRLGPPARAPPRRAGDRHGGDGRPADALWRRAHGGAALYWWNFVSSRAERIEQAKEEWARGRFDTVPGDEAEFIPLPEAAGKPRRATGGRPFGGAPR